MKKKSNIKIQSTFQNGVTTSHKCKCNGNCLCGKSKPNKQQRLKTSNSLTLAPMLGYDSFQDFFSTLVGNASGKLLLTISFIAGLSGFITDYIYSDAKAIYFLLAILGIDVVTGVLNSLKQGTFCSRRLPRILGVTLSYILVLSIGWNAAKHVPELAFVPGAIYGVMVTTVIVSILENLNELGLIGKGILNIFKSKIK